MKLFAFPIKLIYRFVRQEFISLLIKKFILPIKFIHSKRKFETYLVEMNAGMKRIKQGMKVLRQFYKA